MATSLWRGGWCRCVLAMGNSVAPVVHLVLAHHKDSQCAALMHRSGAECARDGEKLKGTRRCCLLHLEGAPSASDDAGEEDAEAVVQAPVGVVVEWARVMGWRGTVDSVARGVRFWQLVRLGVAGRGWASLLGVLGGDVGRARMACGRQKCGRRCACRVTQKVGVVQRSAPRGTLGRQDLVGKAMVWGWEAGGGSSVVCVGSVASRPAIYAFRVTLEVWAVVAGLGRAFGRVRLTERLAARFCCVRRNSKCISCALICTARRGSRRPSQWSEGRGPKAVVRGLGKWHCAEVRLERSRFGSRRVGESGGWLGNAQQQQDGREVQVWFGHGELSGSDSAFGS